MKQKNKKENNLLFEKYYETRGVFLEPEDEVKRKWFSFYVDTVYSSYLSEITKKGNILDIGCSRGFLAHALYEKGFKNISGVDLSSHDIKKAQHLFPEASFYCENAFSFLEKNKNKFDCIILKAVIEHIDKKKVPEFLKLIKESLRAGGTVLIDVYNANWFLATHERYMDFTHESGFTRESLRQVMSLYFKDISVSPIASPLNYQMGRIEKWKYQISRKVIQTLFEWAEPEMRGTPFTERILIAKGTAT